MTEQKDAEKLLDEQFEMYLSDRQAPTEPEPEEVPAEEEKPKVVKKAPRVTKKKLEEEEKKLTEKSLALLRGVIHGGCKILEYFDLVESSEDLGDELQSSEALTEDILGLLKPVINYIPYLGVASGAITIGKHITIHAAKSSWMGSKDSPEPHTPEPI